MFCNQCGSKLAEGEGFCSNCGIPVETAPAQRAASFFAPAQDLADHTTRPRPQRPTPETNHAPANFHAGAVTPPVPVYARPAAPAPVEPVPARPTPAPVRPVAAPYDSEAPTLAERAAVEAPSVIRRPPVMAPAPKKTKKSGLIWLWIIIALLVAGLIGVAVWGFVDGWLPDLFAGDSANQQKDSDKDEENPYADWNKFDVDGLIVYLPEDFEKEENRGRITSFYRESGTDSIEIEVEHDTVDELSADIEDAEDLADYYIDEIESDGDVVHEYETMNGVPYVVFSREDDPEDVMVLGFYSDGAMYWVLAAENFDPDDVEETIPYVTSGRLKKSSDDRDDDQGHKDSDAGWNEYELDGLILKLPQGFEEEEKDDGLAYYDDGDVEIRVEYGPMNDSTGENAEDMSEAFYEMFCDEYEDEIEENEVTVELKRKNGVPYMLLVNEDGVSVVGFYSDGKTGWVVAARSDEADRGDELIGYATGCELG